jgi:hypothetical protein
MGQVVRGDAALQMAPLRVVPLFETLSDLEGAGQTLRSLLSVPWYRKTLRCAADLQWLGFDLQTQGIALNPAPCPTTHSRFYTAAWSSEDKQLKYYSL